MVVLVERGDREGIGEKFMSRYATPPITTTIFYKLINIFKII